MNKMCINCRGIEALPNEEYCLDCIIDAEKIVEDENGNQSYYRYCIYCKGWYNIEDGHRCWRL